jgi:hypothetical protein
MEQFAAGSRRRRPASRRELHLAQQQFRLHPSISERAPQAPQRIGAAKRSVFINHGVGRGDRDGAVVEHAFEKVAVFAARKIECVPEWARGIRKSGPAHVGV